MFHGTIHETRCPSPGCSVTQERELADRRCFFVPLRPTKTPLNLEDRGVFTRVPTIQKNTRKGQDIRYRSATMFGSRGGALAGGAETSRVRAQSPRPPGKVRRF